jgi:gas vesicle protein
MVSKILKEVLERVETWPEDRQEDIANLLIEMEQQERELRP